MAQFSAMKTNVNDVLDRTDLTSQVGTAINRAIGHYSSKGFWFQEVTGTFSTVIGQKAYGTSDGIPTDIREVAYVSINYSGSDYDVLERSYDYLEEIDTGNSTGVPQYWAWFQEKIYFYPVPNAADTITLSYTQDYAALSADSDTNDFTDNAEELIEARAAWWVYTNIVQDQESANVQKQRELEALQNLETRSVAFTNSGNYNRPTEY